MYGDMSLRGSPDNNSSDLLVVLGQGLLSMLLGFALGTLLVNKLKGISLDG
jgi:hypothetical protein